MIPAMFKSFFPSKLPWSSRRKLLNLSRNYRACGASNPLMHGRWNEMKFWCLFVVQLIMCPAQHILRLHVLGVRQKRIKHVSHEAFETRVPQATKKLSEVIPIQGNGLKQKRLSYKKDTSFLGYLTMRTSLGQYLHKIDNHLHCNAFCMERRGHTSEELGFPSYSVKTT